MKKDQKQPAFWTQNSANFIKKSGSSGFRPTAPDPHRDKPHPASVTVVDPQIYDCSRPVRPLALPAEAVLKVIPLVSESVGSIESSWLKFN